MKIFVNILSICILFLSILLLFITFPVFVSYIFYGLILLYSILILFIVITKKIIIKKISIRDLLFFEYIFCLNLIFEKYILSYNEEIFNMNLYNFKHGFVLYMVLTFMIFFTIFLVQKKVVKLTNIYAHYVLHTLPFRIRVIDNKLNRKEIDSVEAEAKKNHAHLYCSFYVSLDGIAKIFLRYTSISVIIYFVYIILGCLIGIYKKGFDFQYCLNFVSFGTFVNMFLTNAPVFFVCCSLEYITNLEYKKPEATFVVQGRSLEYITNLEYKKLWFGKKY